MPKNNELLAVLQNTDLLSRQDPVQRTTALDALLKADTRDPKAVRAAVEQNTAFWTACSAPLMAPEMNRGMGLLAATPVVDYFQSDRFLDPNLAPQFAILQQKAVEQRIRFGLQHVDKDILVDMLKYNPDECRAYLASKPDYGDLKAIPGWMPDIVPAVDPAAAPAPATQPNNYSRTILTNESITTIQNEVFNRLLIEAISSSNNQAQLTALREADTTNKLMAAAQALGLDANAAKFIRLPLRPEIQKTLNDTLLPLEKEAAKSGMAAFVSNMSEDDLRNYQNALEDNNLAVFKHQLPEPYHSKLEDDELKEMKAAVGKRYLQMVLPTLTIKDKHLLGAINAANEAAFKTALKKIPAFAHDYIDSAVTEDSISSMKQPLLLQYIEHQQKPDALPKLMALDKAEPLEPFKAAVASQLAITDSTWLQSDSMGTLKQAARIAAFRLLVAQTSSFGADAHPQLLNAFNQLEPSKQRELLAMKPDQLLNVLKSKELHQVQHYLGRDAQDCTEIVVENERYALLKRIHNHEVARVLANLQPAIPLNQQQIAEINKLFVTTIAPDVIEVNKLTDFASYKNFVDKLKVLVSAPDDTTFYNAFSLVDDGSAFAADKQVAKTIAQQQQHNIELFRYHHTEKNISVPSKERSGLLLGLAKAAAMSIDQASQYLQQRNDPKSDGSKLLREIKHDLEEWYVMEKNQEIKTALSDKDDKKVQAEMAKLSEHLDELIQNREALTADVEHLNPLAMVKDIHLMSPAFRGKAKTDSVLMLDRYKDLSEQCDLVIDKLRRNKIALEGYLKQIPGPDDIEASDKTAKKLKQLDFKILDELQEVEQAIEFYGHIQKKLQADNGIIKALERAVNGENQYVYRDDYLTSYVKGKEGNTTIDPSPVEPIVEARGGPVGQELSFLLGENQSKNDIRVFDYSKPSSKPGVVIKGSFTEQTSVSKDQEHTATVTITAIPTWSDKKTPPTSVQEEEVKNAQIEFYLDVAMETLAKWDGKPTKDNPITVSGRDEKAVRAYYAALLVLGVDKKAIAVRSSAFKPEAEPKKFGFLSKPIDEVAAFKKSHTAAIDIKKEQLKQLMDIKEDTKGTRKGVNAGVVSATQNFKEKNADIVRDAKDKLKQEGPAPSSGPGKR